VIASNTLDGYQLFRSINARGQPLTDLDIVRGEVFSIFQRSRLAAAWSEIEDQIGTEQLSTSDSTVFPLTAQLVNYNDWTSEDIMRRREQITDLARDILRQ
jgi:hypothetical protein